MYILAGSRLEESSAIILSDDLLGYLEFISVFTGRILTEELDKIVFLQLFKPRSTAFVIGGKIVININIGI